MNIVILSDTTEKISGGNMKVYITDIAKNINKPDEELNQTIASFIESSKSSISTNEWRLDNYADLRRWAYPDKEDYLDGIVKLSSDDEDTQTEGQEQIDTYTTACLAVKARFPKE